MDDLEIRFKAKFKYSKSGFKPRYNATPSLDLPIISEEKPDEIELFRWGLVPHWAKDERIGIKMINARAETVMEKPSYKMPFSRHRCLILTDGFYEWHRPEKGKSTPYRFEMNDKKPFAFAGIYDIWKEPSGNELKSFSIITTTANKQMKTIHERMPVILHDEDYNAYLDPHLDPLAAKELLQPYDSEMHVYKISSLINNPRNETAEVLTPA